MDRQRRHSKGNCATNWSNGNFSEAAADDDDDDDDDDCPTCNGKCCSGLSGQRQRRHCGCKVSAPLLPTQQSRQRQSKPANITAAIADSNNNNNNNIPKTTPFHGLGLYYLVGASHQTDRNHYTHNCNYYNNKLRESPPQPLALSSTSTRTQTRCATCQSNYIDIQVDNSNLQLGGTQTQTTTTSHCCRCHINRRNSQHQQPFQFQHYHPTQQQPPLVYNNNNNNSIRAATMKVGDYDVNIRTIGIAFFILASIFCVYGILTFKDDHIPKSRYVTELKFVSLFNRHGDRAPSDALPNGDPHKEMAKFFWPNGLHNLTDAGKLRQYKLGLETRRHYAKYLDFNASQILAYSSPLYRCQESLELTLRGLFDIESYKDKNLKNQYDCYLKQQQQQQPQILTSTKANVKDNKRCLAGGAGSPDEYKKVDIDTKNMRALIYEFLNDCKYRKEHPSPVDADLTNSFDIKRLPGMELLRKTLQERYNQSLNFDSLGLWSSIASEMNLVRTEETLKYAKHYLEWANKPIVNDTKSHLADITLFDLYEAATVLAYRDRVVDTALRVQIGPIMSSIIDSQKVALDVNATMQSLSEPLRRYKDKKMVIYSGHDSIMQLMLNYMGAINYEGSFESRIHKLKRTDDELSKFLNGIKMSEYGMSFRLELLQTRITNTQDSLAYVQLSIYNRADAKFQDIEYRLVPFGSMCRRKFVKKYPKAKSELARFYPYEFQINQEFSCPYELFKNVTADIMIDQADLKRICDF